MEETVKLAAQFMALAARTAPKGMGKDFLEIRVVTGEDKDKLGDEMVRYATKKRSAGYARDGKNVKASAAVLLVGLRMHEPSGLDCGACGFGCEQFRKTNYERDFKGPNCMMRLVDLGVALGSAAKTASILNVDNRVMVRVGVAARRLKMLDATVIFGIPLSATGKNLFFDRPVA